MTIFCKFALLGTNLEAICAASSSSEKLVPNPFNKQFALSSSLQGRFWDGVCRLSRDSIELKQKRTLQSIQAHFHSAVSVIETIDSQYRSKIITADNSKELSELKRQIIDIGQNVDILFSLTTPQPLKERLESINRVFEGFSLGCLVDDKQESVLDRFFATHALCIAQERIGRAYPFTVFAKILERQKLETADETVLQEWIEKLQRSSAHVSVSLLHTALRGCAEILQQDVEKNDLLDKLSTLERRIISKKASLLEENDPDHMQWVGALIPECSRINAGKYDVIVGKQKLVVDDKDFAIFELKDWPDRLIVCGKNTSQVGVWRSVCTHFAWSIQPVVCHYLDPNGRFCIIDNIDYCLADVDISLDNTVLLNELAHLLEFWATHINIPKSISCRNIFVKAEGKGIILKVILPLLFTEAIPGDYNRLEEFCLLFAKGNLAAYTYLMKQSRLMQHPVAIAYEKTALRMLTGNDSDRIETELALHDITDPEVLERAKKYVQALKQVQGKLFKKLRCQLKIGAPEDLLFKAIGCALVQMHKESGFFSVVHPELTSVHMLEKIEQSVMTNR